MNKTKIEWCDYTANPVKGYCPMACEYCYARAMYDRFGWDKTVRMDFNSAWYKGVDIRTLKEPSRIFVCSTIELFGEWVGEDNKMEIIDMAYLYPQHTFIFLTKQPDHLFEWNPWPDNAWVGATATDERSMVRACSLRYVDAKVRFVSFEPLLGPINGALWPEPLKATNNTFTPEWVIIGAQTGHHAVKPNMDWVAEIVGAADSVGLPVFLKDNLGLRVKRREFPI